MTALISAVLLKCCSVPIEDALQFNLQPSKQMQRDLVADASSFSDDDLVSKTKQATTVKISAFCCLMCLSNSLSSLSVISNNFSLLLGFYVDDNYFIYHCLLSFFMCPSNLKTF